MTCDTCDSEDVEVEFTLENPSPFIDGGAEFYLCEDCYQDAQEEGHPDYCNFCDKPATYVFTETAHDADEIGVLSMCSEDYDPFLDKFKAQLED